MTSSRNWSLGFGIFAFGLTVLEMSVMPFPLGAVLGITNIGLWLILVVGSRLEERAEQEVKQRGPYQ